MHNPPTREREKFALIHACTKRERERDRQSEGGKKVLYIYIRVCVGKVKNVDVYIYTSPMYLCVEEKQMAA